MTVIGALSEGGRRSLVNSQDTFIVGPTQGQGNEETLEQAARTNSGHAALVASGVKAQKVSEYLREAGMPP
jgi:predicted TIM-barrel enzyme